MKKQNPKMSKSDMRTIVSKLKRDYGFIEWTNDYDVVLFIHNKEYRFEYIPTFDDKGIWQCSIEKMYSHEVVEEIEFPSVDDCLKLIARHIKKSDGYK